MKNIVRISIFLVLCSKTFAQIYYPVVARVTQTPPYAVYLADYANPAQANLSIQIQQNDATITSRSIKLKIFIEGQGFNIESTDMVQGEPALMLNYGQVYNLSSAEVANYFKQYNLKVNPNQYNRPFNEGVVKFGVQVLDFVTNRPLSGVQWGAPVWIVLNEPPVWIMPQNNIEILPTTAQNIVFQWAPRHSNVADVEYEFTIKELLYNSLAMGNVQNIFLAQPNFYTAKTTATTLVYNATMPPLVEGRTYGYRVRAISKRGLEEVGVFKNNGFSEVQALAYGEPMMPIKPPIITGLHRDDMTNITVLDWKGELQHTSYVVAFREKGMGTSWTGEKVTASSNLFSNSFTFKNLDPFKSYEIRVGAEDKYNQSAYSESVFLDSMTVEQAREIELKGKVLWSFSEEETSLSDNSSTVVNQGTPSRNISSLSYSGSLDTKKYPLGKANVSLISSDFDDITAENLENRAHNLIRKVVSDDGGLYSFETTNLTLIKGFKYLYVIIDYTNGPFNKAVYKFGDWKTLKVKNEIKDLTLRAHSLRYSPKLISKDLKPAVFEEIGLYRLSQVASDHPYLLEEGNTSSPKVSLEYNGQVFQKVADFTQTATVGALIGNSFYSDQYILKVKQANRKSVFYPVNSLKSDPLSSINHVTDYFNYIEPIVTIHGIVMKGNEPLVEAIVQGFGKSTITDSKGYYVIDIPETAITGENVKIKAIDPLTANNFSVKEVAITNESIELNFSLSNNGFYIESQVVDVSQKPISGALVRVGSKMIRTDANGWFSINGLSHELPQSVTIMFDGITDLVVPISGFTKNSLQVGNQKSAFLSLSRAIPASNLTEYYDNNYTQLGIECSEFYSSPSLVMQKKYVYRIVTVETNRMGALGFINLSDSSRFTSATLKVDGAVVNISKGRAFLKNGILNGTGGYISTTTSTVINASSINGQNLATYVEEDFSLNIPETTTIKDTSTFLVYLRQGVEFKGIVYDSTTYIEGLHVPGSVPKAGEKLNIVEGATVSVSTAGNTKTDSKGEFRMVLPVGKEIAFELTKSGFTKTTTFLPAIESNDYKSKPKDFYMMQLDTNTVPTIKTLMGFEVKIDRIVINTSDVLEGESADLISEKGNRTYKISGKLFLDGSSSNRFVSDKPSLNFTDILVVMEGKSSENALIIYKSANLTETSLTAKLFDYAPVKFSGNPIGEPFLRLLAMKGQKGHGKIGASNMTFTKSSMAGLNFGTMKLDDPDEEEEYSFGGFNDDISDALKNDPIYKNQLKLAEELEKKEKAAAEKARKDAEEAAKKANMTTPKAPSEIPKSDGFILGFASQALEELDDSKEYKIIFNSTVSDSVLVKEGIDPDSGPYYKAPFAATNIAGIYSLMNMYINQEEATLNKDGISLSGHFAFPRIWKLKNSGPLVISTLSINTDFNLEEISIGKSPNSKKAEITKLSIAGKWILYVNELQMYNNFKGFGLRGSINMDKENYLKVESFGLTVSGGNVYPNIALATPPTGLTFKAIKFTTLPGKVISFKGNAEEESYELDAAFKMEFVQSATSNAGLKRISAKIFPITVDRFLWSTTGKFLVAINADKTIELGPVKVRVNKVFYTKGGAVGKSEINNYLKLTQEQANALNSTTRFNDANTKYVNGKKVGVFSPEERKLRDAVSSDALFVNSLADEVSSEDPAAKWAFAFAGGLQVTSSSAKGMDFDSQLSFYIGDFGSGIEYQINEIALKLDAPAFKVAGKVKIETAGDRIGFEGSVEVETVKRKFAAAFKFYQLYNSGGSKTGIEIGAALKVSTLIPMGPVTWTSIGGGFDLNTASQKYKFFFMGSAVNTGVPPNVAEYRDINVSVEFDIKACGGLPVIKGGMSVFVNNTDFCKGSIELDFCKIRLVGKISCQKEFIKGVNMKVDAIIIASKDGFFAGANVKAKIFGNEGNGIFAIGGKFNLNSSIASELSTYKSKLPDYIKQPDRKTFSGLYLEIYQSRVLKSSGKVSVGGLSLVSYNLDCSIYGNNSLGVNFINGNFMSYNTLETNNFVNVSVLGYGLNGRIYAKLSLNGGYTNAAGWNISGYAYANIQAYNNSGAYMSCNSFDWRVYDSFTIKYPCGWCCFSWTRPWGRIKTCKYTQRVPNIFYGFKVKVCVSGFLVMSYAERGVNSGWKFRVY